MARNRIEETTERIVHEDSHEFHEGATAYGRLSTRPPTGDTCPYRKGQMRTDWWGGWYSAEIDHKCGDALRRMGETWP